MEAAITCTGGLDIAYEKSSDGFEAVYDKYFEMIYRICLVFFNGGSADAEDAVQTVFMKYLEADDLPETEEHTKAWLIVTAQNTCKSMLRRHHRRDKDIDSAADIGVPFEYREMYDAVMRLPDKERMAIYLNLFEGYTAAQAAKFMGCKENAVYQYIHRARKKLKKELGE